MARIILTIVFLIFQATLLLASPGGKIVRDLLDNPLARVLAIILGIIFFPFIIRGIYKRRKAISETKKILSNLSQVSHNHFDEINLKNRITDVFTRVHKAWSEQNVDDCTDYMTHWYSQNQQTVFLEKWKEQGLYNVCTIKEITDIQPIHIRLTNDDDFEGTRIMYAIDAEMEDYLVKVDDSTVIEGKKGFKEVEKVWTFVLSKGIWKVDNIEESNMISEYQKMEHILTNSRFKEAVKNNALKV